MLRGFNSRRLHSGPIPIGIGPKNTRKIRAKRQVSDSPTLEVRAQPAISGQWRARNLDHAEGVFETG
jgi:hypothetical protein